MVLTSRILLAIGCMATTLHRTTAQPCINAHSLPMNAVSCSNCVLSFPVSVNPGMTCANVCLSCRSQWYASTPCDMSSVAILSCTGNSTRVDTYLTCRCNAPVSTLGPTWAPTRNPGDTIVSAQPSLALATRTPSRTPTRSPTAAPTPTTSGPPSGSQSSRTPTRTPSRTPTRSPTAAPTRNPSDVPTSSQPSRFPTGAPTNPQGSPTSNPTTTGASARPRSPTPTGTVPPTRTPTRVSNGGISDSGGSSSSSDDGLVLYVVLAVVVILFVIGTGVALRQRRNHTPDDGVSAGPSGPVSKQPCRSVHSRQKVPPKTKPEPKFPLFTMNTTYALPTPTSDGPNGIAQGTSEPQEQYASLPNTGPPDRASSVYSALERSTTAEPEYARTHTGPPDRISSVYSALERPTTAEPEYAGFATATTYGSSARQDPTSTTYDSLDRGQHQDGNEAEGATVYAVPHY